MVYIFTIKLQKVTGWCHTRASQLKMLKRATCAKIITVTAQNEALYSYVRSAGKTIRGQDYRTNSIEFCFLKSRANIADSNKEAT
jgi:hypothetical protein